MIIVICLKTFYILIGLLEITQFVVKKGMQIRTIEIETQH